MRATPLPFLLLAVLLLAPSAAACSFVQEPPAPAAFFLWKPQAGTEVKIPVEGRHLGAGCELSNEYAFDGTRFLWHETSYDSLLKVTRHHYYLQDVGATSHSQVTLKPGTPLHLSLDYPYVVQVVRTSYQEPIQVWRIHLTNGQATQLPIQPPNGGLSSDDSTLAWMFHPRNGNPTYSLYDTAKNEWIANARPLSDFRLPATTAHLIDYADGWLLMGTFSEHLPRGHQDQVWAHHLNTKAQRNLTALFERNAGAALDGSTLTWIQNAKNYQSAIVHRVTLPDGIPADYGTAPHNGVGRISFQNGYLVQGSFGAVDAHSHTPVTAKPWSPNAPGARPNGGPPAGSPEPSFEIPGPTAALGLLAVVAATFLGRSRKA